MQPTSCKKQRATKPYLLHPTPSLPSKKNTSKHQRTNPRALGTAPPKTFHLHCGQTRGSLRWWWKLLTSPRWRRILGCCARGSNGAARLRPVATVVAGTTGIRPLTGSPLEKQNKTCWRQQNGKNSATFWFTLSEAQWPKKKHVAWCSTRLSASVRDVCTSMHGKYPA